MTFAIPDYLYNFIAASNALLLVMTLFLIWVGVQRMRPESGNRVAFGAILSAAFVGWFALALYLGARNTYWAVDNPTIPVIQFGVFVPILLGLWLLFRSARMAQFVDAVPLSWLVGIQVYRALGVIFVLLWLQGLLPGAFAIPAGFGDILTGVLALAVAIAIRAGRAGSHRAAYWWSVFGLLDLVVAVTTGVMTSPGPLQVLSFDAPNVLVSGYPLVMVPTFAVPLSVLLHALCFWKLRRML